MYSLIKKQKAGGTKMGQQIALTRLFLAEQFKTDS